MIPDISENSHRFIILMIYISIDLISSTMCNHYPCVRRFILCYVYGKKNKNLKKLKSLQLKCRGILFSKKNSYFHVKFWNVFNLEVWEVKNQKWSSNFLSTVNLLLLFETVIGLNKTCKCPRSYPAQQWHDSRVIKLIYHIQHVEEWQQITFLFNNWF